MLDVDTLDALALAEMRMQKAIPIDISQSNVRNTR
jgi:hypothetical protein